MLCIYFVFEITLLKTLNIKRKVMEKEDYNNRELFFSLKWSHLFSRHFYWPNFPVLNFNCHVFNCFISLNDPFVSSPFIESISSHYIIIHFPPFCLLLFLPAREKDVQKVCANSSEDNLQPFKEKMERFLTSGESRTDLYLCENCRRRNIIEILFLIRFTGRKYVSYLLFYYLL